MAKLTVNAEIAKRMITANEALDLLEVFTERGKKRVHTMEKSFFGVMGCNMDLSVIKKRIKLCQPHEIFISNVVAGHEVVFKNTNGWLYLETDSIKLTPIKKQKRIK